MKINLSNGKEVKIVFIYHKVNGCRNTKCLVEVESLYNNMAYRFNGYACQSDKDHDVRFIGRSIALTRAIHHLPREERTEIWKAYLAKVKIPGQKLKQCNCCC